VSPISSRQLLQHMEVGGSSGLFVLGSLERRVTLYSQQVRALNLAWSLFTEHRLKKGDRVLVVGGGGAGLTFAAGAARLGAKVSVLERGSGVLSTFQGNHTRWLHPHIYDWPQEGAEQEDAGLPLMNWQAGSAGDVASHLQKEWAVIEREHGIQVWTQVSDIQRALGRGPPHDFTWNAPGFQHGQFEVVVFAVGFGPERQLEGVASPLYWKDDDLHQAESGSHILVSGIGDGGLVDLFRSRFQNFRHEHFVQEWLSDLDLKATREALLAIGREVQQQRLSGHELYRRYQEVPVPPELDQRMRQKLRAGVRVELNGMEAHPLGGQACVLNLFIASRLLVVGEIPYHRGALQVSPAGRRYEVTVGHGKPRNFDRVIVRHGPQSTLEQHFSGHEQHLEQLRARNELDQTRERLWEGNGFAVARPTATGRAPERSSPLPQGIEVFGRHAEVERLVHAILDANPGATAVLGPPGVGKTTVTRAALQDRRVVERFLKCRHFVRLDGAVTADSLIASTAQVLGLAPGEASADQVTEALAQAPALLVLDNAETPLQGDSRATEDFLQRLSQISGLALVLSIRGLLQPHLHHANPPILVPPLKPEEAGDLFCSIAHNVARDHPQLPRLLEAMGYLPLAVVLLAHAAQGASLELTLERWDQERAALLSRGKDRDSDLATSMEVSLTSPLMTEEACRLLSTLALLPAGVASRDRASVLQAGAGALSTLQKAALAYEENGRWRILPPIREYLLQKRPPTPEDRKRVTGFYFQLARQHGPEVGMDTGHASLALLDPEYTNIETLLQAELHSPEPTPALEVLLRLNNFLRFSGHGSLSLLEKACAIAEASASQHLYAQVLRRTAQLALRLSRHERARALFTRALPLFEQLGDLYEQAQCIRGLASIALDQTRLDEAQERFERAATLFEQEGREGATRSMGNCVHGLGKVAYARGHYEESRKHFERALGLFEHPPHAMGKAHCLRSLGDLALTAQQFNEARQLFTQAKELFDEAGELRGGAHCLRSLGDTALLCARLDEAQERYEQALPVLRRVGSLRGEANCHKGLGTVALRRSQQAEAVGFFKQALAGFKEVNDVANVAECQRLLNAASPP
jgi:tetratricopeptide (TPR) repeat protein